MTPPSAWGSAATTIIARRSVPRARTRAGIAVAAAGYPSSPMSSAKAGASASVAGRTNHSGMDRFMPLQHRHIFPNAPRAGFGSFCGLHPKEDGVPVSSTQSGEEGLGLPVPVERRLKIVGHNGALERIVGPDPAAVALRAPHLPEPRWLHPAGLGEHLHLPPIDLGPD